MAARLTRCTSVTDGSARDGPSGGQRGRPERPAHHPPDGVPRAAPPPSPLRNPSWRLRLMPFGIPHLVPHAILSIEASPPRLALYSLVSPRTGETNQLHTRQINSVATHNPMSQVSQLSQVSNSLPELK